MNVGIIAQLNVNAPPALLAVIGLVVGMGLMWLLTMRKSVLEQDDRTEPRHDPPIHREYATKQSVSDVDNKVDALREEVVEDFRELRKTSAESRRDMYNILRETREDTKAQGSTIAEMNGNLKEVRSDIKGLISQTSLLQGKVGES